MELVAKVRLQKNWKLKTKFRFTLRNPPLDKQRDFLKKYLAEHKSKCDRARKTYSLLAFSMLSLEQCLSTLKELGESHFLDLEFEPADWSVFDPQIDSPLDVVLHWRRPSDFLLPDFSQGLLDPQLFYETIEPNDVKPGVLGDEWFLSAVATLAERPALVERLFVGRDVNREGVYKVRVCKNGEWVEVTVDDMVPCYPEGEPLFASGQGNELWVMLLEKAYAKLHGNYYSLQSGLVHEALLDLTGCPTLCYDLSDDYVQHFIENGQFWDLLRYFDDESYLLSLTTPSTDDTSLPRNQSFTVVLIKDVFGNQLLNLRSPLQHFEWKGDWSEKSGKWTQKMRDAVGPVYVDGGGEDGTFWISYMDAVRTFKALNVCRVRNWEEVRIKGKFIRVQDIDDSNTEVVISKWYYSIDLHETTKIIIGVH